MAASEQYSTEGPVCPHCLHVDYPDSPSFYDERTTEMECGACGRAYAVSVYHNTSWTTEAYDHV